MYEKLPKLNWTDGVLVMGIGLVALGVGMSLKSEEKTDKITLIKVTPTITVIQSNNEVVFDISGEVVKPGVYRLKKGSRIEEALVSAGGLGVKADKEWVAKNINQAELINDGEKFFIPKTGEVAGVKIEIKKSSKININTAGVEELDKLSGIGPAMSQRIIDYRNSNNGFKAVEEIKSVSGIGDKLFEKIKEEIEI